MTIDELDRIVCQALAAEGRLCLTVHDGAADLEADGLFAKVDDGLASGIILAHMAYMVNEMVERIVGADALGFSRLVGAGTNGHDAHVDFFADVCKLLAADRSAVPAFERLYGPWPSSAVRGAGHEYALGLVDVRRDGRPCRAGGCGPDGG